MSSLTETESLQHQVNCQAMSPLLLEGLIEFNRVKWGVTPQHLRLSKESAGVPSVETVVYTNKRGRILHPRISPYVPMRFMSTPTESQARLGRQWLTVSELLARDMHQRGLAGAVPLSPDVADVRAWQWEGFQTDVRYTYYVDFPFDDSLPESAVRRRILIAERSGFRFERATNLADLFTCLESTASRKSLRLDFDASDLNLLMELVGEDHVRAYVCYSSEGKPACGAITLHNPGARAISWVLGTEAEFLPTSATQFCIRQILDDLETAGATGLDFVGAQVPSVAAMKAAWGARLVPYYRIDGGRMRAIAKHARDYIKFRRSA